MGGPKKRAAAIARDRRDRLRAPTNELRDIRDVNSIYHNNGIQTWLLRERTETSKMS